MYKNHQYIHLLQMTAISDGHNFKVNSRANDLEPLRWESSLAQIREHGGKIRLCSYGTKTGTSKTLMCIYQRHICHTRRQS
jgi:hypothetical protein